MSCLLLVPPVGNQRSSGSQWIADVYCLHNKSTSLVCLSSTNNEGAISLSCSMDAGYQSTNLRQCSDLYQNMAGINTYSELELKNQSQSDRCKLNCSVVNSGKSDNSKRQLFGKTFWYTLFLLSSASIMFSTIWAFLYAMCYAMLGENRNVFGKQRVWGTIGAIITSIISAIAMNKYGSAKPEITFTPCFIGNGVWLIATGVSAIFCKLPHIPRNNTMAKDLYILLKQPQIILLLTVLFIMGVLWGTFDTFLFVFLRSLGASSWVMGACLFVQYIGEIPSLYYSGRIIKRLSYVKCVYMVLLAYSIRFLGTSLISNPWWELPFSCLKSVVFSIGYTAVSVYASSITPPSMHATLQAMVQTVHFPLGKFSI